MKQALKRAPVIGPLIKFIYFRVIQPLRGFGGSNAYWQTRYSQGGNSGDGSYNELAHFKAEVLNSWVEQYGIGSVIEFGCGDGNQLTLARYPRYTGVDISPQAILLCRKLFEGDHSKTFLLSEQYVQEKAELSLSLDVIYHLVEDEVFHAYMTTLFSASTHLVGIYSSNTDVQRKFQGSHVRNRRFTDWIAAHAKEWQLLQHVPNRYPYDEKDDSGSFADFFLFHRPNP